jgi:hypothetical protein
MTGGEVQSGSTRPRTSELWASIERILITSDSSYRIAGLKRKMAAFRTSFAMEEIEIQLQDGQTLAIMFKDLTWQALEGQARHVKPRFLYDPLREIETYRTILHPHHFSVPTFYGADVNEASERYWLFLEYVPAWRLTHHEEQLWHQAARWVAELHVRTARLSNLPELARRAHLLIYDADFCQLWPERALAYAEGNGIEQAGLRTAFEYISQNTTGTLWKSCQRCHRHSSTESLSDPMCWFEPRLLARRYARLTGRWRHWDRLCSTWRP